MPRDEWSDEELLAALAAYMEMLDLEEQGKAYVKTDFRRGLIAGELNGRSEGSIEFRMQNISAVLEERGLNWIHGYKPARNVGLRVSERLGHLLDNYDREDEARIRNPAGAQNKMSAATDTSKGPTTGPVPSNSGYLVREREPSEARGWTYIAQFGESDIYKFGYSNDVQRRMGELNQHIPNHSGELESLPRWELRLLSDQSSEAEAYEREQQIGARVEDYRTEGERFVCPPEVVEDIAGEFRLLSADLGTQLRANSEV